jgi:PAS domain S-box-containing protein
MADPITILIVEDCEVDATLLVRELKAAHFEPAWKRVNTETEYRANLLADVDVIFSDFSVPGFSTQRALEVLREGNLDIPFIIVSGMIGEEQVVENLKAGATDYLPKDRLNRLGSVVRRALRETTERRDRQQAEEALRESEHRFRQVTESIDEVFWLTDTAKNQMIYISPAYEKIWGRTCESLYATPQSWMEAIHPEDRERVRNAALTLQASAAYDVEYRIIRLDGSTRWIRDRAFPIRNESGRVYRVAGVAEDITSRRQLEEQFRQAQKMEAIGQLAAGVAHDFNNLLTVMHGNAELLLLHPAHHDSQTGECLKQITAAAERAASLTRQLLVFSRKQAMHLRPLSLNDVISNLAWMLKRIIGEHIEIQYHCAASLPLVEGDAAMLEQVLVNLVLNARDAMPGGGQIHIATDKLNLSADCAKTNPEARTGEFVCLIIRDTGTGIAPDHLAHIFEPFFTTKEPGKGTGLGLATVYGIIKQHQGWTEVWSLPGKGTAFTIFLPAIPLWIG